MPVPHVTFLMADDDRDDALLTEMALRQASPSLVFRVVHDGVELLEYLRGEGEFAGSGTRPAPNLILLDLNMPRLDGLQTLAELKADPLLRPYPVIVFSTSYAEMDVERSYALGASAFMTKPMNFVGFKEAFQRLSAFYLNVAALPSVPG